MSNYYPLLWQFQELSNKASNNNNKVSKNGFSPREEIYRSMIKELTDKSSLASTDNTGLVKKASGILRLTNLKNQSSTQSNVAEVKPYHNYQKRVSFRRSADSVRTVSVDRSSDLDAISQSSSEELSKSLNFKEIWDYIDATHSTDRHSESEVFHGNAVQSEPKPRFPSRVQAGRPPWRYFSKSKGLNQSDSISRNGSSIPPELNTRHPSTSSFFRKTGNIKDGQKGYAVQGLRPLASHSKRSGVQRNFVNNVVSVRGQLVVFKGEGFENITNWFEDPVILKHLKARSTFRKELDLTGFSSQEIQFRLYDGHKLVVEAVRANPKDALARFKHTVVLPKDVRIENLIVCRYASGKLIIQDVERPKTV